MAQVKTNVVSHGAAMYTDFQALSESGILWLINYHTFWPRGLALTLMVDEEGETAGWALTGTGEEPVWPNPETAQDKFDAANETIETFINMNRERKEPVVESDS